MIHITSFLSCFIIYLSINQAAKKSKIKLMENKRLTTVARVEVIFLLFFKSIMKNIWLFVKYFSVDGRVFLHMVVISTIHFHVMFAFDDLMLQLLRYFRSKGRRLAPFFEIFQKKKTRNNSMTNIPFFFLSISPCSSSPLLFVIQILSTSLQ